MDKCFRCPHLLVRMEDSGETTAVCGRATRTTMVVPYEVIQLWTKHKDEMPAAEAEDCKGVQMPRIEPLSAPPEAITPLKEKLRQEPGVKAWPLNYGEFEEDTCPKCFTGDLKAVDKPSTDLASRGMGATEEFKYTLYQLLRCDKCGYEEYIQLSKVPKRYWQYRRGKDG